MKRLAFDARTIGDRYPGIGRYAHGVWQALGERIDVTLLDPKLINTRFAIEGKRRRAGGVRSPLSQIAVPLILIGERAERYYSPYFLMAYAAPCEMVATLYDAAPLYEAGVSAAARLLFRAAHWLVGRKAKRIIVLSGSARDDLAALGVPRGKMIVCPPGVDARFHPAASEAVAALKYKYALPEGFWLCFGSTKRHKNTHAAVEAAKGGALVIVGGPPVTGEGIYHYPFIPESDLPALYCAARGLLFPSLREGFGLPIVEAMACGAPVACLPAPGVKEAAGGAAMFAADMTTEALAEAARALDNPELREAKRSEGLRRAQQFNWDQTVKAILDNGLP